MKRWIALTIIFVLGLAAIVFAERRKVDSNASAGAILYLVADTERELTRMPVRFTRMSDENEIRVGNELAESYSSDRNDNPTDDFTRIQSYLNQVGATLAQRAHRKLPYKFHYIPDKNFANAFALPGGHVFVGKGLLALMDSEDELAAVLGHEIEHIDHYHCAERLQTEQAMHKIPLAQLVSLPVAVFEVGYSKEQELEADREGTRLSVEAGYSANGALRLFERFQHLFDEAHEKAKNPQDEISQVMIEALEGYFRSHPLPSERIVQMNQIIAASSWPTHPERDLAVADIFWSDRAEQALHEGLYPQAQQLATQTAKIHLNRKTLELLAQSQFLQADFAGAAATYRKILDRDVWSPDIAYAYAWALAALHQRGAANEFQRWMASLPGDTASLQVPLDGLLLIAGDPAPARRLQVDLLAQIASSSGPDLLSDLSWWWYLAKDYSNAVNLQKEAIQRRPGNLRMLIRLAWIDIDQGRLADSFEAITRADQIEGAHEIISEKMMAAAVARWQAHEPDTALLDFDRAISHHPEWGNPNWVASVYSPLVAKSLQEMQVESNRRQRTKAIPVLP
jgi:beta-barrel assembly-enhancing protease